MQLLDVTLSDEEHVRRIGKLLGSEREANFHFFFVSLSNTSFYSGTPYLNKSDSYICNGDYFPRISQETLLLKVKKYYELNAEKDTSPAEAANSDDTSSTSNVKFKEAPENSYIDLVFSRQAVKKYDHLHYLLDPSRDPNEFLPVPIVLDTLPEDVLITWRMDLSGHSK